MSISDSKSNDISVMSSNRLEMKQPYKLMIDIWGVITCWDFANYLKYYIENNLQNYLTQNWSEDCLKEFVKRLREQSITDKQTNSDLPLIAEEVELNKSKEVIESIVENIKYRKNHKLSTFNVDLELFYNSIWSDGYRSGELVTHSFDDVKPALHKWTTHDTDSELDSIKVYTFASGPSDCQKLFLSSTVCGDLSQYIVCGINSFHKFKTEPNKYKAISSLLENIPKNILYLTDRPDKAKAAIEAGMRAVIVLRPGNRQHSETELSSFQTIDSFEDLQFLP